MYVLGNNCRNEFSISNFPNCLTMHMKINLLFYSQSIADEINHTELAH